MLSVIHLLTHQEQNISECHLLMLRGGTTRIAGYDILDKTLRKIQVCSYCLHPEYLCPLKDIQEDSIKSVPISETLKTIKNKTMNIIKAIKTQLSATDRALVKHGYLTDTGERTSKYSDELKEVAINKLIAQEDTATFRDELAAELEKE